MKLLILAVMAIIGLSTVASAKTSESIKVRVGQTRTADGGKVKIKFVSVAEDSRCPVNARCIWAGNAKIKVAVSTGKLAPKVLELESRPDSQPGVVYGYKFQLVDLTPRPGETNASPKTATVSVTRSR